MADEVKHHAEDRKDMKLSSVYNDLYQNMEHLLTVCTLYSKQQSRTLPYKRVNFFAILTMCLREALS